MDATPTPERVAELRSALAAVRERIAAAATAAGRDPAGVTLVAVTKTWPASDVAALAGLGVVEVGENKDQEARAKRDELDRSVDEAPGTAGQPGGPGKPGEPAGSVGRLRWHMLGRLQSNKARSVAAWADAVHSLDRVKIVRALDRAAADERPSPLPVFVQVSLDGDAARGGAVAADVPALADAAAAAPALRLAGVMAVAPAEWEADRAFAELAGVAARVRADHPGATAISAGMSGDLEAAIAHGATHVRVGSALLGSRPPLLG